MKAASARLVIHNLGHAGRAAAIVAPSTLAVLSQLEIKDPQQQAKADTISENDNEISLQEPIDYPGATPNAKIRNILRERSPADPVSQHFFSCGKYEKVVQTAANRPTAVFIERK